MRLDVLTLDPMAGPWRSLVLAIRDRNGSSSRPLVGMVERANTTAPPGLTLVVTQLSIRPSMPLRTRLAALWLATIRQLVTTTPAPMLCLRTVICLWTELKQRLRRSWLAGWLLANTAKDDGPVLSPVSALLECPPVVRKSVSTLPFVVASRRLLAT